MDKFNLQLFNEEGQALTPSEYFGKVLAEKHGIGHVEEQPQEETPPDETPVDTEEVVEEQEVEEVPKYKIKVNNEEREATLEELIALAQKNESAERRFEEAARLRREAEELQRQFEQKQREQQLNQGKDFLLQNAKQRTQQFINDFQANFGEEFLPLLPGNEWQQAIFNQYMYVTAQQEQQSQAHNQRTYALKSWINDNPDQYAQIEEAMFTLGSSQDGRKQFFPLAAAKARLDAGQATSQDVDLLISFGDKVLSTPKVPPAVVKPKPPAPKSEPVGAREEPQKQNVDWERYAKDGEYRSRMFQSLASSRMER